MLLFGLAMVLIMIWKPRGLIVDARAVARSCRSARPSPPTSSRKAADDDRGDDDPLLAVEHLTMRFGGLVAVNDLSFAAARRARSPR